MSRLVLVKSEQKAHDLESAASSWTAKAGPLGGSFADGDCPLEGSVLQIRFDGVGALANRIDGFWQFVAADA